MAAELTAEAEPTLPLRSQWMWDQSRAPDVPPIGRGGASTDELLAKQRARDDARLRSGQTTTADDVVAGRQRWAERMTRQHREAAG